LKNLLEQSLAEGNLFDHRHFAAKARLLCGDFTRIFFPKERSGAGFDKIMLRMTSKIKL